MNTTLQYAAQGSLLPAKSTKRQAQLQMQPCILRQSSLTKTVSKLASTRSAIHTSCILNSNQTSDVEPKSRLARRDMLGLLAVVPAVVTGGEAKASIFSDLAEAKRNSQIKFLLGPIRLGKQRLESIVPTAGEGTKESYTAARQVLRQASLDCVNPSDGLSFYAQSRDVCTYSIIHRSVTKGPAAKNPTDTSENGKEATDALLGLVGQLRNLDLVLLKSEEGNVESQDRVAPEIQLALDRFDSFETAIQKCLGLKPDLGYELNTAVFEFAETA